MTKKRFDSEARWTRYEDFYDQSVLAVLQSELPVGVVSLIEYVQDEFDYIANMQDQAAVGGGSLSEYEAQLVLALATLPENFNYLIVRQALEALFAESLSAERIVNVESGDEVMSQEHRDTVREVTALIGRLSQNQN